MTKFYIRQKNKVYKSTIYPIFLPFFGCPRICTFCNQSLQTATEANNKLDSLSEQLEKVENALLSNKKQQRNEIAFYGGTFTALPEKEFLYCLEFVKNTKKSGLIQFARCSTRPDACSKQRLSLMKEYGIDTIELGIQSFSDISLHASNRAYSSEIAEKACKDIKDFSFNLGIQLLPNMPKQEKDDFLFDIKKVIQLKPDFTRLYPCLVVENTLLAEQWRKNEHEVWDFNTILSLLSDALFQFWQADIPVIRIGVAYEEEFYKKVLAGVFHPHLGQLVQERAMQKLIENLANKYFIKDESFFRTNASSLKWHFPLSAKGFLKLKSEKDFYLKYSITSKNIVWHESKEDESVFISH